MDLKERIARLAKFEGVEPRDIERYPGLVKFAKIAIPPGKAYPKGHNELAELEKIYKTHKWYNSCWRRYKPRYMECKHCGGYWQCLDQRLAILKLEKKLSLLLRTKNEK